MKNFIQYDKLKENEDSLQEHEDTLQEHEDTLQGHKDPLQEHEDTLQEHGGVRGERQFPPVILLTTAIPRGDLHKKTVHLFYEKFIKYLDGYTIHHIINIDYPEKIKPLFFKDDTIELFEQISYPNVKKYYILPEDANFCKAYCNVITKIYEENIISEQSIIWWLEDDWTIIRDYNFVPLFKFLEIKNTALSFTNNAPLCSFRGGPIMNYGFFTNYFDIHKTISIEKDPEYQVGKGIRSRNDFQSFIGIICIFLLDLFGENINIKQYQYYYKRKFDKNIKLKYFLGFMETIGDNNIYLYEYKDESLIQNIQNISRENIKKISNRMTIEEFNKEFDKNSMNYINFFPDIFVDIGRKFCSENSLIKSGNSYK